MNNIIDKYPNTICKTNYQCHLDQQLLIENLLDDQGGVVHVGGSCHQCYIILASRVKMNTYSKDELR